ncbi:hypothetical protein SBADM41S_10047 [Streptomyces badius]
MFSPSATVAKMRMLTAMRVNWSVVWVKGKAAAATKAAATAMVRYLVVSAERRAMRPALKSAGTAKPEMIR